jgi:hypothetical protein
VQNCVLGLGWSKVKLISYLRLKENDDEVGLMGTSPVSFVKTSSQSQIQKLDLENKYNEPTILHVICKEMLSFTFMHFTKLKGAFIYVTLNIHKKVQNCFVYKLQTHAPLLPKTAENFVNFYFFFWKYESLLWVTSPAKSRGLIGRCF